jgi:porin
MSVGIPLPALRRRRPASTAAGVALGLLVVTGLAAQATDYPGRDYLTGNWGGFRDDLKRQGVELGLDYTTEPMWNVSGGEVRGGTYTDNIGLDIRLDLQALIGLPATTLLVKVSKRDGDSVSIEDVAPSEGGNLFPVQQIYGGPDGQVVKLVNVQLNTRLLDDRLDLAYGRLVANDDFLSSPLYCQFLNNAFCGSPKAVFFENPFAFSAYPSAQWGLRGRYDTADQHWTVQAAVYDADINLQRGDPSSKNHNQHGLSWSFGANGVVLAGEVHYRPLPDTETGLPGTYKLGGYWMSGDFEDIGRSDGSTVNGNAMLWILGDQMLYRERAGSDEGLTGFATYVQSLRTDVNLLNNHLGLGLVYTGLLPGRPRDSTGLAFTRGWVSGQSNQARREQGLVARNAESVIELNYKIMLGRGIAFQPDVQYIMTPAGTGEIPNAWLLGAQVTVDF